MQVLAMAHHHIKRMVNREEIENIMKSSAYSLALKLCQPSGNVPPSIGAKRDECGFLLTCCACDPARSQLSPDLLCL
jgi:hypothetical protein